jgi:thioredoxin 1
MKAEELGDNRERGLKTAESRSLEWMKEVIVKRILRAAAIAAALMLFLAGCARAESAKAVGADATANTLVTFVELGSVSCIPCKMMQPIMRQIQADYRGQVKVVFYDVWTEEGKPYIEKYSLRVIPTQVFLDAKGVEFFRHEGFFPKEQLVAVLKAKGVK